MSIHERQRRGMTMRELLATVACLCFLFVILKVGFIAPASRNARSNAARLKDATQLSGIQQSWLVFSRDFDGVFPTPGLLKRLPDPVLGETPGRGPEDISQNTTANLYSMCVMQNYFTPELCIGPTEPSSHVKASSKDTYDWSVYKPANGAYWDSNFKADLHDVSNVSYAHQPLCGERKLKNWRESLDQFQPMIGNRGPLNGVADPQSITNRIHPPYDRWNGNIVFADNHVEFLQSFCSKGSNDNLFAWDTDICIDVLLTFTKSMSESGPVIEHD
jgi:prepilin-type processing-associated H-X9-DG protein